MLVAHYLENIVFGIRRLAKKLLPDRVADMMRRWSSALGSKKRLRKRLMAGEIGLEQLVEDLRAAGINAGEIVMVHSSLSSIGNVSGGANTVIQSFQKSLTSDGTLLMPCYNSAERVFRNQTAENLTDLRTIPALTGVITETFRTEPGVRRSSHPFSSVCAWGKMSEYVIRDHATDPHVCHAGSPIGRLVELDGKVIGIGVSIAQGLGVAHHLEDTTNNFPIRVHASPTKVAYIDSDGIVVERSIVRYDPRASRTRIDYPQGKWILGKLTAHLRRRNILHPFRFGNAEAWQMQASILYSELKRLSEKGVTMYLTEDDLTDEIADTDNW